MIPAKQLIPFLVYRHQSPAYSLGSYIRCGITDYADTARVLMLRMYRKDVGFSLMASLKEVAYIELQLALIVKLTSSLQHPQLFRISLIDSKAS